MMRGKWIIQKDGSEEYVNAPGSRHSYTKNPLKARKYRTKEEARNHCCGNEHVVNLNRLIATYTR